MNRLAVFARGWREGLVEGSLRWWMVLGFLFLYLPIAIVVLYSFNDSRYVQVWRGFSTRWYSEVFDNRAYIDALIVSLKIAALNALVASVLGTLLAIGMSSLPRTAGASLGALMVLTIATPEVLLGLALLIYFSRLGFELGAFTIMAGHVVFNTSIVAFLVRARLSNVNRSFEEAAADLGARPWKVMLTVTLPLLSPAIFAGALLAFTFSFDNYVLTFFTAGPQTLPLRIFGDVRFGSTPEANAVASLIIVFSLATVILAAMVYRIRSRQLGAPTTELLRT